MKIHIPEDKQAEYKQREREAEDQRFYEMLLKMTPAQRRLIRAFMFMTKYAPKPVSRFVIWIWSCGRI